MNIKYDKLKDYHEQLCLIGNDHDLVEVDAECFLLMANPTKKQAAGMYDSAIAAWFDHYGILSGSETIAEAIGWR